MNLELVDELVHSWLEVHKKSALSYLILRLLKAEKLWSKDIEMRLRELTGWKLTEKSLYRTLRRMKQQGTIEFESVEAERTGATRKVYSLTPEGEEVLKQMKQHLSYVGKVV